MLADLMWSNAKTYHRSGLICSEAPNGLHHAQEAIMEQPERRRPSVPVARIIAPNRLLEIGSAVASPKAHQTTRPDGLH
jgi:hypothetical protein